MADPHLGDRWAHVPRVLRAQRATTTGARAALGVLLAYVTRTLDASGQNPDALDAATSGWGAAAADRILPELGTLFGQTFKANIRKQVIDPSDYATRRLLQAQNRLSGVPDEVFGVIRTALNDGRVAGESIPQLAKRVDAVLSDDQRWAGRAATIARTEVIAANNAGAHDATRATAALLGHAPQQIVKQWLSTNDSRTRPTHRDADGQQVVGMSTAFDVGGDRLQFAGDPSGSDEETISCRCTCLYLMPGDPDYPTGVTASAAQETLMAETPVDCTCCAGAGDHDCPHECVVCGGSGTYTDQSMSDPAVTGVTAGDPIVCAGHHGRLDDSGATHNPDAVSPDSAPEGTPVQGGDPEAVDPTEASAVTAAAGDPAPVLTEPEDMAAGDPAPVPTETPEIEAAEEAVEDKFYGVCTVENVQTGDGRVFAPNAITWDTAPLPMPLGWQVQDAPGHDGSVVCGRIDTLQRFGGLIAYTGTWDLDGAGWETRRLVEGQFLTGLSVDTDDCEAEVVTPDGTPLDDMDYMFDMDGDDPILLVTRARVRSAAMCRVPAFVEAFVANGVPPAGWAGERPGPVVAPVEAPADDAGAGVPVGDPEAVTAALVASAVAAGNPPAPSLPSAKLFANPELTEPTSLTVDGDHVYGHLALFETCHIGMDGVCTTAPDSASNYAYFATGIVDTDNGPVQVGQLTMDTGHAPLTQRARAAAAHYDDTGTAVADVAMGQDIHGIWFSGRVRPGLSEDKRYALKASGKVSGDWREIGGSLDLVAALVVNVPGFPVGRPALAASGARTTALVAAGIPKAPEADTRAVKAAEGQSLTMAEVFEQMHRSARLSAASQRLRDRTVAERASRLLSAGGRLTVLDREARLSAATKRMGNQKIS